MTKDTEMAYLGSQGGSSPKHMFKYTWQDIEDYTSLSKTQLLYRINKWNLDPRYGLQNLINFLEKCKE